MIGLRLAWLATPQQTAAAGLASDLAAPPGSYPRMRRVLGLSLRLCVSEATHPPLRNFHMYEGSRCYTVAFEIDETFADSNWTGKRVHAPFSLIYIYRLVML